MLATNFSPFFKNDEYLIDEKIGFFKFSNSYKVYDNSGNQIGNIVQKVPGWHKFLRLFLSKALFPFTLEIKDMNEISVASIKRGWTFWMSEITILDGNDQPIGSIKQKFKFFTPTFTIFNGQGNEIGKITGDWKAWNFKIIDASGNQIGDITKKWNGVFKEAFTTADKYKVSIVPQYAEDFNKMAIVAGAITIDMVLKESK